MFVLRITGLVCDFDEGQLVPVYDDPPDDEAVIETEADAEIAGLTAAFRRAVAAGSEEAFRSALHLYRDVEFPDGKTWLLREEADALVELGVAEPVTMGAIEDALAAWGLL